MKKKERTVNTEMKALETKVMIASWFLCLVLVLITEDSFGKLWTAFSNRKQISGTKIHHSQ